MLAPDAGQLLLQVALSVAFCMVFRAIGVMLLSLLFARQENKQDEYVNTFYAMLAGILFVVICYSIAVTSFRTINILLAVSGIVCFRKRLSIARVRFSWPAPWSWTWLLLLTVVFVMLFNFLPESEYKQKDSFFYLKISEALMLTGQENASNYYNAVDPAYHGVEWYHYFELWLNAFLLRFTQHWLPGIQTLRIVCYTIFSVTFMNGLLYLYELVTGAKARFWGKLFCFSFLFFMPDVFPYLPSAVRRIMTFNFENNYLERPNFRIVYLFFLPVIDSLWRKKYDGRLVFFLMCLCIVHPAAFAGIVPAVFMLGLLALLKYGNRIPFAYRRELGLFFVFTLLYGLFYILFSGKGVPAMYHTGWHELALYYSRSYRFVLLTIFCSLAYSLLIGVAGWLLFKYLSGPGNKTAVEMNSGPGWFLLAVIICSIVMARILGYIENLYQVAYTAFMAVSLFVFIVLAQVAKRGSRYAVITVLVMIAGYSVFKMQKQQEAAFNIAYRNGQQCYGGTNYSGSYLASVIGFMKTAGNCAGGYMADSVYYRDLYYSNRNPAVYHLPITYIIANNVTTNIDYCLSGEDAILYDRQGTLNNNVYLRNAIARSWYHRYRNQSCGNKSNERCAADFVLKNKLRYLVLTSGIAIDAALMPHIAAIFTDSNTGERFLVLR